MRVRGLKRPTSQALLRRQIVAPHAGAWIETILLIIHLYSVMVAPHAGAWIETLPQTVSTYPNSVAPMRVRGLKRRLRRLTWSQSVAPHAGAWIETPP